MPEAVRFCIGLILISTLCLVTVVEGAEELKIDKTFVPEECQQKSKNGDQLTMHYTGTLTDGTQFDSSRNAGRNPFSFKLGAGRVIKGWDQGLLDMCVGEKRTLTIPSSLGYGDRGAGAKIPPGATLVFDTELLNIDRPVKSDL